MGWALIRGWALINFFCLWDGRLFEVGAKSRLGAYSNNYGITVGKQGKRVQKRLQCFAKAVRPLRKRIAF